MNVSPLPSAPRSAPLPTFLISGTGFQFFFSLLLFNKIPDFCWTHGHPQERLHFPDFFAANCGHVMKFWPMGCEQSELHVPLLGHALKGAAVSLLLFSPPPIMPLCPRECRPSGSHLGPCKERQDTKDAKGQDISSSTAGPTPDF